MDKIYTALDYATQRDGVKSVKERIEKIQRDHMRKNIKVKVVFSNPDSEAVKARIWQGHWIADCECRGAEFVDPQEPIFFCWGCGNARHGGRVRLVEFPEKRAEIEAKILERPVESRRGLDDLAKAEAARAVIGVNGKALSRTWIPGETLEDLATQQDEAIKAHKEKVK